MLYYVCIVRMKLLYRLLFNKKKSKKNMQAREFASQMSQISIQKWLLNFSFFRFLDILFWKFLNGTQNFEEFFLYFRILDSRSWFRLSYKYSKKLGWGRTFLEKNAEQKFLGQFSSKSEDKKFEVIFGLYHLKVGVSIWNFTLGIVVSCHVSHVECLIIFSGISLKENFRKIFKEQFFGEDFLFLPLIFFFKNLHFT